ncbi:iron chelate uptake ABC transporter family permease subunit [Microvirga sp. W0021]|uniref:Iron chelate uptake ABC transporter family permease subunit n=1 Tax=Hohaiivirga grylli TaxID=3133970 RepID=A0ABV0BL28_9HYPH
MPRNTKIFAVLSLAYVALLLAYVFVGLSWESWGFSFPRRIKIVSAIILVGTAIALSSVVFQTITTNHILTPSIMGLDSLYLFLQTIVVFALGSGHLVMISDVPGFLMTLLLMVGASTLLFLLMFRRDDQNIYFLVLVGFVFGTVFSGLADFMQVIIDPNEYSVLEGRMFATFNRINLDLLWIAAPIIVALLIMTVRDFRALDVLSLGRTHAINLGVNYRGLVLRSLISIAVMTSVATVLVGPITFLGILVVSLARALFKTYRHHILAFGAILVAVTVLLLGMLLTERILMFRTPLSVIINFVGGLYFLYLLLKAKNA